MFKDRFLVGILIGISLLVVAALVLFFVRQGSTQYIDDSQPAGALHNYVLALQQKDYERAYSYLADHPGRPSFDAFRGAFYDYQISEINSTAVEIGEPLLEDSGETASIPVTLIRTSADPFTGPSRRQELARLVNQNGKWKISVAPYPFWGYNWEYLPGNSTPVPAAP